MAIHDAHSFRFRAFANTSSERLPFAHGSRLAGSRFVEFFRGLDENPHLPDDFGTILYGGLLSPWNPILLDGLSSPDAAAWWSRACHQAKDTTDEEVSLLHAAQAGETLDLLVRILRNAPEHAATKPEAIGSAFGADLLHLTRDWPADAAATDWEGGHILYDRTESGSWRADLASIARDHDPSHVQIAIDAALVPLGAPFLESLALRASPALGRTIEGLLLSHATMAPTRDAKSALRI